MTGIGGGFAASAVVILVILSAQHVAESPGSMTVSSLSWTPVWAVSVNSTGLVFPALSGTCYATGPLDFPPGALFNCTLIGQTQPQHAAGGQYVLATIANASVGAPFSVTGVAPFGEACLGCQAVVVTIQTPSVAGTFNLVGEVVISTTPA